MKYLIVISITLLFYACSRDMEIKPADIKYGQDVCAACSMIISEVRHSAQYILSSGDVKKFDDIGCMIDHITQTNNELDKIPAIFVRDYLTNKWINAKETHFLQSSQITTPMGHGIIAFASDTVLKNEQSKSGGKHLGNLLDLINKKND